MDRNLTSHSNRVSDISWRINIIYNSMIIVSILMIIVSTITAIGTMVWIHNNSTPHKLDYNIGAYIGMIGGIMVIFLGIISISLLIYRIVLQKQLKNTTFYPIKRTTSMILFIVSWLPPIVIVLIELFRTL